MIPELGNAFIGLSAAMPLTMNIPGLDRSWKDARDWFDVHRSLFGIIALVLAGINMIERLFIFIPLFSGSWPQTILLLLLALCMADTVFGRISWLKLPREYLCRIEPYIGAAALFAGLYVIL